MLKRNLVANYIGQGWSALMGVAFIPIYINYLGIEAYGLIGIFAVLNACLSLLDVGMTPALSREMGRFTGGSQSAERIRDLLRSIELITFSISLVITVGVALGAGWLATNWISTENLPISLVTQAIFIMGCVSALRFSETIYHGSIIGLQRQVLFNIASSSIATLRGLGAVAILIWVSPSIQAFFLWQGFISIVTLVILSGLTYSVLPPIERRSRFSLTSLRGVWRFAGGMLSITFLSLLLTQVDKVMLSKILTLSEYGYYALAAIVAGVLYVLITPITQAVYPRLCQLESSNFTLEFAKTFHKSAQLVSVFAGSAAIVLSMFAETFLRLWTQDPNLAERTTPLLSLLVLGNLLNGLMWVPYQAQLAYGWTSLTIKVNLIAVTIIVPTILLVAPRYGALGAASAWCILNIGYVLIAAQFMFRRILRSEMWQWYIRDLLMPLSAAFSVSLLLKLLMPVAKTPISEIGLFVLASLLSCTVAFLSADQLRGQLRQILHSRFVRWTT